jgi:hypothetical protein
MLTLFNNYTNAGDTANAVLVGRNLFNRTPSSSEIFGAYFGYLCGLAEASQDHRTGQEYAGLASIALAFYEENAELDEDAVEDIAAYRSRLSDISLELFKQEQAHAEAARKENEIKTTRILTDVYRLKEKLHKAATRAEFDKLLPELGKLDAQLDKNALGSASGTYDALAKEIAELMSAKMSEFERTENRAYNERAAQAFSEAFSRFQYDEAAYRNQTRLFELASTKLFAYDASRLFNETLIYYSHVYNYIFGKLSDEGKLALTRFSIECERKLG